MEEEEEDVDVDFVEVVDVMGGMMFLIGFIVTLLS